MKGIPTLDEVNAELARRSLSEYVRYLDIGFTPATHHELLIDHLEAIERRDIRRLMVFMPPGSAKALALDTPIPTPSGWTDLGDLRVGDKVFDENGRACNVTWVSPVYINRPVYKIITDCGDEIVADRDHEWLVRLCGKPRKPLKEGSRSGKRIETRDDPASQFKIKETWELARRRAKRPMVKRALALYLPPADLPVDPYLLGVWLGDGTSSSMSITSSDADRPWMRGEIERLGYRTSDRAAKLMFGVLGVRSAFVALGLVNDPHHKTYGRKHIPAAYMRASVEQRTSLVQGLVDTDGTVCRIRGCATFCSTNLELALQFREIVRSLGVKAGWSETRAVVNGKDCGASYKVSFYMKSAARMPRKAKLCRDQARTPNTYIDAVEFGYASTRCIEVDSPSHMFLCGRSMTPTHNSTYCSHMFPSWYVGRNPKKRIIEASHTADIAEEWGRKVRNTIKSPEYAKVFDVAISGDSSAAYRWDTTHGGGYFAAGVLGNIMGKRSDLGIIDDPVKSRQDADSSHIRDRQWAWYKADFWTRLKPNACQILIMTRWHEDDLAGRLLNDESEGGEGWHVIELPMEAEADDPLGRKPGERLWPEWFTDEMVVQAKRDQRNWWALYQQKPRPDEGNILKANWWRKWPKGKPEPECLHIFHSWDTAFSEQDLKTNSYSARTSWGVFRDADGRLAILLLGAWRDKCDYPTLRREARRAYMDDKPDRVLIEKKASGQSLIQDMRASGVPVSTYQPDRDKVARAYAVQAMLESGMIYYPDRKWAQEVIDECAAFPAGTASDYVDTCTQAWLFVRNGQWVEHPDNPEHEIKKYKAAPAYG